jgi:hypothetical protein
MNKFSCWACDFSDKTGEGNLARLFVKKNYTQDNYQIFTPNNIKSLNFINTSIFNYKYISPLIGILFCWYLFIKRKKVVYLNYLPLWNCLIFIFLPPKTIFGPITGGAYFEEKQYFIRKFIFPILYKISELFLLIRNSEIYFSTELLKIYLTDYTIKKSKFNYVFNFYSKTKKINKNIDFLIYYRKHTNKEITYPYNFIDKLISLKFKIHIVGDHFVNKFVFNHGYISNKKINFLLARTFFSISSYENFYTLFNMECFKNNVVVIVDKTKKKHIRYFKKNFMFVDFRNKNFIIKKIK